MLGRDSGNKIREQEGGEEEEGGGDHLCDGGADIYRLAIIYL